MTDDIVKRLRIYSDGHQNAKAPCIIPVGHVEEAANTIEALEDENEALKRENEELKQVPDDMHIAYILGVEHGKDSK